MRRDRTKNCVLGDLSSGEMLLHPYPVSKLKVLENIYSTGILHRSATVEGREVHIQMSNGMVLWVPEESELPRGLARLGGI